MNTSPKYYLKAQIGNLLVSFDRHKWTPLNDALKHPNAGPHYQLYLNRLNSLSAGAGRVHSQQNIRSRAIGMLDAEVGERRWKILEYKDEETGALVVENEFDPAGIWREGRTLRHTQLTPQEASGQVTWQTPVGRF